MAIKQGQTFTVVSLNRVLMPHKSALKRVPGGTYMCSEHPKM